MLRQSQPSQECPRKNKCVSVCSAAVRAAVGRHLARLRARDALATAGKMPALPVQGCTFRKGQTSTSCRFEKCNSGFVSGRTMLAAVAMLFT